jgi:hypothetical protein
MAGLFGAEEAGELSQRRQRLIGGGKSVSDVSLEMQGR